MVFFPDSVHADAGQYALAYFRHLAEAASSIDLNAIAEAGRLLAEVATRSGSLYSCGNGGSAAIANHLVCDCLKGVRTGSTLRPRVYSLSSTIELITAIANDIGYEEVFSSQLRSLGRSGDVLIAISSSGASSNIIAALEEAKVLGMQTIAMTGFTGGGAAAMADITLHVDCHNYGVVEDIHQSIMHILAQYLRHSHLEKPDMLGQVKF